MRGIIGFSGEKAGRNNTILLGIVVGIIMVLMFAVKTKPEYFASKTIRHGYLGVEKINPSK